MFQWTKKIYPNPISTSISKNADCHENFVHYLRISLGQTVAPELRQRNIINIGVENPKRKWNTGLRSITVTSFLNFKYLLFSQIVDPKKCGKLCEYKPQI